MSSSLSRSPDASVLAVGDVMLISVWHGRDEIGTIPFSEALKARYQSFTDADISALRDCSHGGEIMSVESGICRYLDALRSGRS